MTVTYGFYDSLSGDRKYNALQLSQLFKGIITDGIFSTIGGQFAVTPNTAMNINVASGRGWFDNRWIDNDATLVLTVLASEPVLPRIDTVVIEINSDIAVRANSIKIIKGTPASSPVAPTLANTATLKQYPLANIAVAAGVTSINAGNITNRIGVAGGTPFITAPISNISADDFFGRFESNFNDWFANLQNQLDANQASNLQNQIDTLDTRLDFGWTPVSDTWTYNGPDKVNVPSDATLKYAKGWGVRFKQGGAYKYMYIIALSETLLTLSGGSDYSVENAPITDIYYSINPNSAFGFPGGFNYTPTVSGPTVGNGLVRGWFTIIGNTIEIWAGFTFGTTSVFGPSYSFSIPFTIASPPYGDVYPGDALIYDAGQTRYPVYCDLSTTNMVVYNATVEGSQVRRNLFTANSPMTWAAADKVEAHGRGRFI
jgi:hypothetical protein